MSLIEFDIVGGPTHHEVMATPVFPLRLRNERLRELVREVAAGLGISQNELIERATEHEVMARGAMLSDDLRQAADRLTELTQTHQQQIINRSLDQMAAGEGQREPLAVRRVKRPVTAPALARPTARARTGLTEAYEAARPHA